MTRPGLAKARGLPFVLARSAVLVRTLDPRWREAFDHADVVSEGSVREEAEGRFWYGSTSLIVPVGPEDAAYLAAVAERNPHVRLRAVRTAHREAACRAPGGLGRFCCEIRVSADPGGLRIDVDVQAPLIERRAHARRGR